MARFGLKISGGVLAGMVFHNSGKKYKDFDGKLFADDSYNGIKVTGVMIQIAHKKNF